MAEQAALEMQVKIGESTPTLDLIVLVGTNIPKEVFLYQQTLERNTDGTYVQEFYTVCNVGNMVDFPAETPVAGKSFVRKDFFSKTYDDFSLLDADLKKLTAEVDNLVREWNDKLIFEQNDYIVTFPKSS